MIKNNKITLTILGLSVLFLQGCASMLSVGKSEYSCTGYKDTDKCLSATQVYKKTNGNITEDLTTAENITKKSNDSSFFSFGNNNDVEANFREDFQKYKSQVSIAPSAIAPVPIKNQADVLRVWIAPWVDTNKQLHSGEFVFQEVQNKTWSIGSEVVNNKQNILFSAQQSTKKKESKKTNKGGVREVRAKANKELQDFMNRTSPY